MIQSITWLTPDLSAAIEAAVTAHAGRAWRIERATDLADLASHPTAILAGSGLGVFVKLGTESDAFHRFEVEASSLRYLADRAGVLVPEVIGIVPAESGTALIMRALHEVERGPHQWREIGRTLACIHRVKGDYCGFDEDNYFGSLAQENTPAPDWPTFYAERRLRPHLRMAVDSGHLPLAMVPEVESVIRRLPDLCGPAVTPVLLHGDAQRNNYVSTGEGTYVVDPALHYGHPELDLAYLDYWQPVPDDVLLAYREELPIDPGFPQRWGLWRLSPSLAVVAVAGPAYLPALEDALRPYV